MKPNDLKTAATYALERMEDHSSRNNVSLGFDCGISLLRDALDLPTNENDERNLHTMGVSPTSDTTVKITKDEKIEALSESLRQAAHILRGLSQDPRVNMLPGGKVLKSRCLEIDELLKYVAITPSKHN